MAGRFLPSYFDLLWSRDSNSHSYNTTEKVRRRAKLVWWQNLHDLPTCTMVFMLVIYITRWNSNLTAEDDGTFQSLPQVAWFIENDSQFTSRESFISDNNVYYCLYLGASIFSQRILSKWARILQWPVFFFFRQTTEHMSSGDFFDRTAKLLDRQAETHLS